MLGGAHCKRPAVWGQRQTRRCDGGGGDPFTSSKPGKPDKNVRMLMAQSYICRMVGKLRIEENVEVIKEALGPHQSGF